MLTEVCGRGRYLLCKISEEASLWVLPRWWQRNWVTVLSRSLIAFQMFFSDSFYVTLSVKTARKTCYVHSKYVACWSTAHSPEWLIALPQLEDGHSHSSIQNLHLIFFAHL